jgi:prepilin-type N-terminal cleavage/methylation domain-containing protein
VSRPVRGRRASAASRHGFTLIEVVIAASLLLLTVVCATPLLIGSQRNAARESRATEARRLAQSTVERLRSLPFAPPGPARTATAAQPDGCAVAALFPHADQGRNGPDAFVVLSDGGPWLAGTFVTRRRVGAYLVTTESRFAAATAGGFAAVSTARLAGYASSGDELPSGALIVTVQVSWTEHGNERSVTRHDILLDQARATTAAAAAASP